MTHIYILIYHNVITFRALSILILHKYTLLHCSTKQLSREKRVSPILLWAAMACRLAHSSFLFLVWNPSLSLSRAHTHTRVGDWLFVMLFLFNLFCLCDVFLDFLREPRKDRLRATEFSLRALLHRVFMFFVFHSLFFFQLSNVGSGAWYF